MDNKIPKNKRIENMLSRQSTVLIFILFLFAISRLSMYLVYCIFFKDFSIGGFKVAFNTWDSGWYYGYALDIANNWSIISQGPSANGQAWWAFFPLFPMIVAGTWNLIGRRIDIFYVGMILNGLFFCASEFFAYKYIMLTRKRVSVAYIFIAFMSLGLYSFYFSALYTEALFLFLLVLCFYYLKKGDYVKMGIAGAFLSATRSTGVMFVFVILAYCLIKYFRDNRTNADWKKPFVLLSDFLKVNIRNSKLVLGTMLVPAGLFAYMLFLYFCTGDGLAFVHVQRSWDKNSSGVLLNIWNGLAKDFPHSFLGVATVIIVCILIYSVVKEKRFEEIIFPVIVFFMGASSSLVSVPRYMVGSFTVVLACSDIYSRLNKVAKVIVGILVVGMELVFIKLWLGHSGLMK